MPKKPIRITRDFIFVNVGIAMLAYETVSGQDRPYIIAAALTLCGLPFALWTDRIRQNGKDD